ncbi:YagK/YfjJ domain-containing protein [Citrobacter sedlakii]|uniref:YagK/YfjJ domain-containing protein n=1 Tax=Citrobacter sedlakii TaxID=67826 RepID=UPI003B430468
MFGRAEYVWVREVGESDKPHYHVAISVNKDTFNCPGDYSMNDRNPGSDVREAWLSATGLSGDPEYRTLVAFNHTPHTLEKLSVGRRKKLKYE